MLQKHILLRSTLLLTFSGMFSRFIGFFYRIFLSRTIGAEGIALYHLIIPLYAIALSISSSGISTSISKIVSAKNAVQNKRGTCETLFSGIVLSLFLSILISGFLFLFHKQLASHYIKEPRTSELLRLIAWSIPFASIHACIEGYYLGLKNAVLPASCQIFSNIVRIAALFLIIIGQKFRNYTVTPDLAIHVVILEEIASSLFSAVAISIHFTRIDLPDIHLDTFGKRIKEITAIAFPLSLNRTLLNVLQSIETLMIPIQLQLYGYTANQSLKLYGTLNGMTMPLILFPTALSFSLSTILLPVISEAQIKKNKTYLKQTILKTIFSCTALGAVFWFLFFLFGSDISIFLFHDKIAGTLTKTMSWLCPLLYLNPALNAIMNGLGLTKTLFFHNIAGLCVRIVFISLFVPKYGMSGIFAGIFLNQIISFILSSVHVYRHIGRQ